ncbi:hypothetical protein EV182_001980 [Spiromyces aspiralis]|uniref:Uncharacterized protein n=1 Tax=Spiromyces aspiralis TaxID=68401 RepID=A0ACC1HH66_9FUNG|nr:hypothetical protein EV182_001980 [Spiromyces aspiralis]
MSSVEIPKPLATLTKMYVDKYELPSNTELAFRAGRCERRGETNWVDPVKEKGLCYLYVEDGLRKLCYMQRDTKKIMDEKYLFEGDSKYIDVKELSGQVWGLRFETSGEHNFFWFQEWDYEKQEKVDYEPYRAILREFIDGEALGEGDGMEVEEMVVEEEQASASGKPASTHLQESQNEDKE